MLHLFDLDLFLLSGLVQMFWDIFMQNYRKYGFKLLRSNV